MKLPTIFVCAALAFTGCHKTDPPAIQWEYQQMEWANNFSNVKLTVMTDGAALDKGDFYQSSGELLNAMGAHNWELVSVATEPGGAVFYLKRPRGQARETYLFEPHYKKEK